MQRIVCQILCINVFLFWRAKYVRHIFSSLSVGKGNPPGGLIALVPVEVTKSQI